MGVKGKDVVRNMKNNISKNIKKYRKLKGFTQEELANQIGVTSQAVSRWEAGAGMPDISLIVPIAQNLGVTTDTLFGIEDVVYDEAYLDAVKAKVEEMKSANNTGEGLLMICDYLKEEIENDPTCYELFRLFVETVAWISAKVNFESFLSDKPEKWDKLRGEAIKKAMVVIKHSKNRELVDKVHFSLAWIYIHCHDYDNAREHIDALPSIRTNRIQERILDKLALFEGGPDQDFDGLKSIMENSMNKYIDAIGAKMMYDMETYGFMADKEFAVEYGAWTMKVFDLLGERYTSDALDCFKAKALGILENL